MTMSLPPHFGYKVSNLIIYVYWLSFEVDIIIKIDYSKNRFSEIFSVVFRVSDRLVVVITILFVTLKFKLIMYN